MLAARFLGEVGDIRRFPSKHHFAAHTGTAPLEASSGQVIRHWLSRAGDRKLNHALYMMAMVQVRRPSAGQAYYQRKLAEGKSPKEALRCLNAGCRTPSIAACSPMRDPRRSPDEAVTNRLTTTSRHARPCRAARASHHGRQGTLTTAPRQAILTAWRRRRTARRRP